VALILVNVRLYRTLKCFGYFAGSIHPDCVANLPMARQSSSGKRVEPRFESGDSLRASRNDRVGAATATKKTKNSSKPKATAKSKTGRSFPRRLLGWIWLPIPRLAYWGVVFSLWGGIIVAGIFGYYAAQLPSAEDWTIPERPPNLRIVAADKSLISNRGVTGGKALRLEEMSPYIAQAVIAIEDRRFHAHFGFDPIGFSRAMYRNISQKRMREGGSTITQQLAKNLFLTPDRTFGRKVQELILAVWMEAKYSKAEILELYLNRVYFGSGATGVDAAAQRYFGKSAKHVTIAEAALLAGLLKAPSRYSPARNPKLAQDRARTVLAAMQREGYVKPGHIDIKSVKPGQHAKHFRSGPEHFVADMVVKRTRKILGEVKKDIIVETTLSPYLMTAGHSILTASLDANSKKRRVSQAALVSMAPDGAIKALIGGRNYGKSQFNRAVEAKRQPGSAFKTFVWLNAMERGHQPNSVYTDAPVRYGKWRPENYDQKYRGPVTLNTAFSKSLNTIAAQLTMEAGPANIARTAKRLGINSRLTANASLALGTSEVSLLELVSAYAPFANGGLRAEAYIIKKITTVKGDVLYSRPDPLPIEVVAPSALGAMNALLASVVENGTGKAAQLAAHKAGGKTGTSQNFRDALFVGHTAHLVTGIWFGNDNNKPTKKLTGGSLPANAWKDFMEVAHSDLQPKDLPGEPTFLAALPATIPTPTPRPSFRQQAPVDQQQTASLRQRVEQDRKKKSGKTILDLILGN